MTVKQQETKNKTLRARLVAYIERYEPSVWSLGAYVVDKVRADLESEGIYTTGEVLAKELRKAQRKGEIRKRIRPGGRYVEYTAVEATPAR